MIAALLLAAAPSAATADRTLACQMVTPAGDPILFSARLGSPTAVLEPVAGTSWPATRVIGPGGWREKKRLEASYHFAGSPMGLDLKVEGERATLLAGKKLRSGLPRAYGFCLPTAAAETVAGNAPVSPQAGASIPAFDTKRWPDNRCALVTRSGRRAWIGYTVIEAGARVELRSPDSELVPGTTAVLPRAQSFASRPTRFGAADGPAGLEYFAVDAQAGEGAKLIEFDRIGSSAEPAAAICGYRAIVRRPAIQ